MSNSNLEIPSELRQGSKTVRSTTENSVSTGVDLIQLMSRNFGLTDLGNSAVLDMGCGNKLVQAFLDAGQPIGRYVGVDVNRELIDYLRSNVTDERFQFEHLNLRNEMYNPGGTPLSDQRELPIGNQQFDVICLFSVFTHLAPHDYDVMLRLLRPYAKPDCRIIYSLFVNETTDGGHGLIDSMQPFIEAAMKENPNVSIEVPDFFDWYPDKPLERAVYSRDYANRLVEGTGWEIESLNDPEECIQHYMICKPA